ncbi:MULTISPECIES: RimK family alpha-L-glutamate ligase [unclassified Cryobacterium]|uniref:ATP-grasp domain-containing protein n=1 Tax=unclassified Cryobacterium TaxID=2649013 RepID=UPI00106C0655|nr:MULTISPECIES: hypothetical protein [unclassified Cryobacterium]TFB92289.1 hypothetical protein E3O39_17470 [Cryobacterium sp. MDB2-A-1]TFC10975.1 hypothetical protein E3O59_02415 [Cryobacterium sp. MDB2-33-2]TFC16086.1 hypothetical protein E3O35_00235 [Cryobacterium sp. MDB2-A-2]TFC19022.1 hypothetical protein E3O51_07325 [Cryobacterium sp. MDB2-10]TFC32097.1 hypothetical protein E3O55_06225 [Cryobacterium sp. MDB1-18-2]
MEKIAFVSDAASLPIDYDMSPLLSACRSTGISADVCFWDDPDVDWSRYALTVLRSPWTYVEKLPEFLTWCAQVSRDTRLLNPLAAIRWSLNKRYLLDLQAWGIPVVPSSFVHPSEEPGSALRVFLAEHPTAHEFVVKPSVGAYSKDVRRFAIDQENQAVEHLSGLLAGGCEALIQPYFDSIDEIGETDSIYFDGQYSHAIRKSALLLPDGRTIAPTQDTRQSRDASDDERQVASAALEATAAHLGLEAPLLYGRIDLIRDNQGAPLVLELELCEPSLSLPFAEEGAIRFARAIAERLPPGTSMNKDIHGVAMAK